EPFVQKTENCFANGVGIAESREGVCRDAGRLECLWQLQRSSVVQYGSLQPAKPMADTKTERDFETGIALQSVADLPPLAGLGIIGSLINASDELGRPAGHEHARKLAAELLSSGRLLDAYQALLHQFLANACAGLRR